MPSTKKPEVAGTICLYGTHEVGGGYVAQAHDGRLFGDGEPNSNWSFTNAMWFGCDALKNAGYRGTVIVFEPNGRLQARIEDLTRPPTFGALTWTPAPSYVISADEILKNSTPAQ